MKKRQREFDIFNLSFLDIISCGFGAVVMLVLISKTGDDISIAGKEQISDLLNTLIILESSINELQQRIASQSAAAEQVASEQQQIETTTAQLQSQLQQQRQQQETLADDLEGLALVESTLKQASTATPKPTNKERDEEVGGIPVDSDYVIFIVDTSGSMQQIWRRVSSEIINVLNIHPEVEGFQILNDMGKPLISGYEGKWIPDTPGRRKSVISVFEKWGDISNSSPVEGIDVALRKYARPNITTSIYVFGDDYTGSSYDPVIASITANNSSSIDGKRLAKIHGVGFISPGTTDRFGILMRELTKQNGGTFLALSL